VSDESPEARRGRPFEKHLADMRPGGRLYIVFRRAALGVYADGFIHAIEICGEALAMHFPPNGTPRNAFPNSVLET